MADFLTMSRSILEPVADKMLGDDAVFTLNGAMINLRAPLEKGEYTEDTPEGRVTTNLTTYTVLRDQVPADPRNATLHFPEQSETFIVADYRPADETRMILILDKHNATA